MPSIEVTAELCLSTPLHGC